METLGELLAETVRSARAAFPDLDFVRPAGQLHIALAPTRVDCVRVELASPSILRLQSLGLTTVPALSPAELNGRATVTASSFADGFRETFDPERLLDAEHPHGVQIRTEHEDLPWAEVAFAEPVELTALHLRGIAARAAIESRDVRVRIGSPGADLVTVYDAPSRAEELQAWVRARIADVPEDLRPTFELLAGPLALTVAGHYQPARTAMKAAAKQLSDEARRDFVRTVSEGVLHDRSLDWTAHGPTRSFRFWSAEEKQDYVRSTVAVADALRELTPHVCFGYGAALAVVRDGDLIPHDDDLDLIVAFEPHEAATLPEAHALVEDFLRARGFTVKGDFFGHRHVAPGGGGKNVDVFSALFEGDRIAWYPGTRGALDRTTMFPTSEREFLGVMVPLPADPVGYLETIYGPGWSTPDPAFKHRWRKKDFADQATAPPAPEPEQRPGWLGRLRQSWR